MKSTTVLWTLVAAAVALSCSIRYLNRLRVTGSDDAEDSSWEPAGSWGGPW